MRQSITDNSDRDAEPEFDANGLRQLSITDFPKLQIDRLHNLYFDRHKIQTASFVSLTKWQVVFGVVAAVAAIIAAVAATVSAIWSGLYTDRYLTVTPVLPLSSTTQSQNDLLKQVMEQNRQGTEARLSAFESILRELQASRSVDAQTYSDLKMSFDRISNAIQSMADRVTVNTAPTQLPPSNKRHK
jgi:hypothetical protein